MGVRTERKYICRKKQKSCEFIQCAGRIVAKKILKLDHKRTTWNGMDEL